MQSVRISFVCLVVLSIVTSGEAQSSSIGQEFVFGYIYNDNGAIVNNYAVLSALVSNANDQPANVTVESFSVLFRRISILVPPHSVSNISVVPDRMQARYGDYSHPTPDLVIENLGIRIRSTMPVSVVAHSEARYGGSADSYTILPTASLGTRYVAVGSVVFDNDQAPNVILVVAYQNDTTISIGSQNVTLSELQVVTLAVQNITTGITVTGSKPFAAYSGNMHAYGVGDDFATTTLLPTSAWGTQFPLVPFAYVDNQQYQIVADTNGTMVNAEGRDYQLDAGQYLLLNVTVASAMLTSNYPVQVMQMGQRTETPGEEHYGDVFFLQLPSVDTWSNTSVIYQPTGFVDYEQRPSKYFIRIYTSLNDVGRIALDNVTISALLYLRIAQSNYYYYETQISNSTHCILGQNATFLAISYTYGYYMGCAFPIAYNLPSGTLSDRKLIYNGN